MELLSLSNSTNFGEPMYSHAADAFGEVTQGRRVTFIPFALADWDDEVMQRCFSDYAHLYSAREFGPRLPEIERSSTLERFFYWSGAALMWIAFPITLPTALYLARRVRKKGLVRP